MDQTGRAIPLAQVTVTVDTFRESTASAEDGTFKMKKVPALLGDVTVTAIWGDLSGSVTAKPRAGQITDVGNVAIEVPAFIVLHPLGHPISDGGTFDDPIWGLCGFHTFETQELNFEYISAAAGPVRVELYIDGALDKSFVRDLPANFLFTESFTTKIADRLQDGSKDIYINDISQWGDVTCPSGTNTKTCTPKVTSGYSRSYVWIVYNQTTGQEIIRTSYRHVLPVDIDPCRPPCSDPGKPAFKYLIDVYPPFRAPC